MRNGVFCFPVTTKLILFPVMRLALFALLVGLGIGCANALHPYSGGVSQRIRVDAKEHRELAFRVLEGEEQKVRADGTIDLKIPRFHNCSRYLFGMRVYDGSPEKMKVIELRKDGKTLQKLSLEKIAGLPKDTNGYAVVKIRN